MYKDCPEDAYGLQMGKANFLKVAINKWKMCKNVKGYRGVGTPNEINYKHQGGHGIIKYQLKQTCFEVL